MCCVFGLVSGKQGKNENLRLASACLVRPKGPVRMTSGEEEEEWLGLKKRIACSTKTAHQAILEDSNSLTSYVLRRRSIYLMHLQAAVGDEV